MVLVVVVVLALVVVVMVMLVAVVVVFVSLGQQLDLYAPVCSLRLVGYTSPPFAFKTSSFALAGSIPTEFGELINLTDLRLHNIKLSGTPSLLI